MFGTLMRMTPKDGQEQAVVAHLERWDRERGSQIEGPVAAYTYRLTEGQQQLVTAVIFEDRESYQANAEAPEQDQWYRELVELLAEPPTFDDGDIVQSWLRQ